MAWKILRATAVALALAAPSPVMAQGATSSTTATSPVASLSQQDRMFMERAASSDMYEIRAGELALSQAMSPDVRRFAQRMIEDHQATTRQMAQLGQGLGAAPPAAMVPEHLAHIKQLAGLGTDTFESVYIDQQVIAHQEAVALFERQARSGTSPELRTFAQGAVPALREHLSMATEMRRFLLSSGANATGAVSRGIAGSTGMGTIGSGASGSGSAGTVLPAPR